MSEENVPTTPDKPTTAPAGAEPTTTPPEGDKVAAQVEELTTKIAKLEEGNAKLRSDKDRAVREAFELKQSQQQAELDTLKATMTQAQADEAQKKFNAEWAGKIDENPGQGTIEFVQGSMGEINSRMEKLLEDKFKDLEGKLSPIQQRLSEQDPRYLNNKDKVDALIAASGNALDRETAIVMAEKLSEPTTVATPGAAPAPNAILPGFVSNAQEPEPKPAPIPPQVAHVAGQLGIKPEKLKEWSKQLAKESK